LDKKLASLSSRMAAGHEGGGSGGRDRVLKNLFEEVAHSFDQYRVPSATVSWLWAHHC
jgi:hypothetical protein